MKTAIAATVTTLLALGLGTAFAAAPQNKPQPNMQTPPSMNQPAHTNPNACTSKYPDFYKVDTKHQGYITKKEASKVPGLKAAFKKADTDHNGKLSEAEYAAWQQSKCGSMGQSQGQMPQPPRH
ncbi:MAG: hypothetical protein ACRERZ_04025 [Gammaproteobacteria bacterium]